MHRHSEHWGPTYPVLLNSAKTTSVGGFAVNRAKQPTDTARIAS